MCKRGKVILSQVKMLEEVKKSARGKVILPAVKKLEGGNDLGGI